MLCCPWAISSCVQERVRVEYSPAYRRARLSRRKACPLLRVFRGREGGVDGSAYLVKLHRRALRLATTLQDGFHHSPSARSERHEGSGSLRTLRLVENNGFIAGRKAKQLMVATSGLAQRHAGPYSTRVRESDRSYSGEFAALPSPQFCQQFSFGGLEHIRQLCFAEFTSVFLYVLQSAFLPKKALFRGVSGGIEAP